MPSEIPQQHHGGASAALAEVHPASPCSPRLSPQFELDHHSLDHDSMITVTLYLHRKQLCLGVSPEDAGPSLSDLLCCALTELYSTESLAQQSRSCNTTQRDPCYRHSST